MTAGTRRVWRVGTLTYTLGPLVVLFFWLLLGDFAWSIRDRSVSPMAQWFLKHLEVSNVVFALIINSFPALITLILGPIISCRSDRHRGRWGRRIPYLAITTPLSTLGMILIGLAPLVAPRLHELLGQGSPGTRVLTLLLFGLGWTGFELGAVASQAVFGGLVNDVVPQEMLGRFFGLFRAISLLDGIVFNYSIIGHIETRFSLILITIGGVFFTGLSLLCLKVKEGSYPPPPAPASKEGKPPSFMCALRGYFRECFSHSYYRWVFFMTMAATGTFMAVNAFSVPFARSLSMDMGAYGKCLAITYAASLLLSYLVGWLADRYHPLRVSMAIIAAYAIVCLLGALFAKDPRSYAVCLVAHGVLSGAYLTSAASIGQRLYPRSRFAQFASAAALMTSIFSMVLPPLLGLLIDASGGVFRLCYLVAGLLSLLVLASTLVVWRRYTSLSGPQGYVAP